MGWSFSQCLNVSINQIFLSSVARSRYGYFYAYELIELLNSFERFLCVLGIANEKLETNVSIVKNGVIVH